MTRSHCHIWDAFWGEDFNSKDGYKAVNKRMTEIIEVCRGLSALIRQRAKTEEEYSKSIQKILKPPERDPFTAEIGRLRNAIDSFRMNNERVANEHQSASRELQESVERLQKYADKLKNDWSVEKEKIKKTIAEKLRLYDRAQAAKRNYVDKFREAEAAELRARVATGSLNTTPKDVERAVKTQDKTKQDAEKADQAYREAIRSLDEVRDRWEKDLRRYYEFCEDCDKQRIKMLQNEMWILSNISSSTYLEADRHCEDIRLALEKIVPEVDIKEFVEKNQTGTKKPAPILYESCHSELTNSSSSTMVAPSRPLPLPSNPPSPHCPPSNRSNGYKWN